jgi:DNA-binding GntR family transcriptional regulator
VSDAALLSPVPAIATPRSKVDFVYDTVKEGILSGRLKPGEQLVQSRIAKSLNVSSIPVMAAMQQLIAEGLVTQEPHHAARVAPFSPEGLQEKTVIRMHLELLATRASVPSIGPARLAELRGLLADMDKAIADADMPQYGMINKAFHLKIYEDCQHRLLAQMITDLWNDTDRHGLRAKFTLEVAVRSQVEHVRLVDLIAQGDVEAAVALVDGHKANFRSKAFAAGNGS